MKSPFQKMLERYKPEVEYYYKKFEDKQKAYEHASQYINDCFRQYILTKEECQALHAYNTSLYYIE